MKHKGLCVVFAMVLSVSILFSGATFGIEFNETVKHQSSGGTIHPDVLAAFSENEYVSVIVLLHEQVDTWQVADSAARTIPARMRPDLQKLTVRQAVISELQNTAVRTQAGLLEFLDSHKDAVVDFEGYFIVNVVYLKATQQVIEAVATRPEVKSILPNEIVPLDLPEKVIETEQMNTDGIEWNIHRVGAPMAWDKYSIDGSGVVVGIMDTGVDWQHPTLQHKWRGYNPNDPMESDPTYSWFDPVYGEVMPYDFQGHGTHVTGTILGSKPDQTNTIGVAPGATWIAANIFTPEGAESNDIIAAGQWMLAPGGDPSKAPDIINNSWGSRTAGVNEVFREMVQNWRAAGILPVFAAGNLGAVESVTAPANYPESFAVAATDYDNQLASFSSRGPGPYGDEIKPEISAPGVNIRSAVPGGGYASWDGTSMAAPHIAGIAALLLQFDNSLTPDSLELMMEASATPLTDAHYPEHPNYGYGYGLVNAYEAISMSLRGSGTIKGNIVGIDNVPLSATIWVVESQRLTISCWDQGRFSMPHSASADGQEFTLYVEAFGYHPVEISFTLEDGEILDFGYIQLSSMPRGDVTGVIRDANTQKSIANAKVEIVDYPESLESPVFSGSGGRYFLNDIMPGSYVLRISAEGYGVKFVETEVEKFGAIEINLSLIPFSEDYSSVIYYDKENDPQIFSVRFLAGDAQGVRFTPEIEGDEAAVFLKGAKFYLYNLTEITSFAVAVYDSQPCGAPGELIVADFYYDTYLDDYTNDWIYVDLSQYGFVTNRDFYVFMFQTHGHPGSPALGIDRESNVGRSYVWTACGVDEPQFQHEPDRDFRVRALVDPVASVSGRVYDANDESGLGGVQLSLICSETGLAFGSHTDSDGNFDVNVPEGNYVVNVSKEGYWGSQKLVSTADAAVHGISITPDIEQVVLQQVILPGWKGDLLAWFDVPHADFYEVLLYRNDDLVACKTVMPGLEHYDFSPLIDKLGAGSYRATVQALGDGEDCLDGVVSEKSSASTKQEKHLYFDRISGPNRYATSVEISKEGWPDGATTVILAAGTDYPDALTGAPLAYALDAPILLAHSNRLSDLVQDEIRRLNPYRIVILGGEGVISQEVVNTLKEIDGSLRIERLGGRNRYETAALIAERLAQIHGPRTTAVLAYGLDFPDALAAASYAAERGYPILLTRQNLLPGTTADALNDLNITDVYVIGGTGVVGEEIFFQLEQNMAGLVTRISGRNRYVTAQELAKYFGAPSNEYFLATGLDFADAVAGAVLVAKHQGSMLLTSNWLPSPTEEMLLGSTVATAYAFGGRGVVSDDIGSQVSNIVEPMSKALAAVEAAEAVSQGNLNRQGLADTAQDYHDTALALVDQLPSSEGKNALLDRLSDVQARINSVSTSGGFPQN